jgi:hypothetical protein
MTESEWRACEDPQKMVAFLDQQIPFLSGTSIKSPVPKATDRKLRLFGVACCRRFIHLLPPTKSFQRALEVAERWAEGLANEDELRRANYNARYGRPQHATVRRSAAAHAENGDLALSNLIMHAFYALTGVVAFHGLLRTAAAASDVAVRAAAVQDDERAKSERSNSGLRSAFRRSLRFSTKSRNVMPSVTSRTL